MVINSALITVGTGINGGDTLMIYAQNSALNTYTSPTGVSTIAPYAFNYLNGTQNVIISEGVEFISAGAFMDANSLVSVTLPNSLKTLDDNLPFFGSVMQGGSVRGAFFQCPLLTTVNWAEGTPTIEYIGGNTFNYTAIESFRIPASVKHIGLAAFSCPNLVGFTVDTENETFSQIDGVLFDKNGSTLIVYPNAKVCTSYTTPIGTETIASFAFNMCYGLTTVTLSEGVTTIQSKGFNYCAEKVYDKTLRKWVAIGGLEIVNLPQSLTEVCDNAFLGCSYLKSLVFTGNAPTFSLDAEAPEHNTLGYTKYDMETDMDVKKVFDNLSITIPEGKANEYYVALYNYSPVYTVLIKQADITMVTYNFETNGGSIIESQNAVLITEMLIPTKEGKYFWGWYLDDACTQEVKFPYAYLEGTSVTLYAYWQDDRMQNGEYGIWAIELFDGDNTVNLTAGTGKFTWFCYTPQTDCKGLLKIPSQYYEYYVLTIDYFPSEPWDYSAERDYMTGEFILNAGETYYFYIWVGENVVDGNIRVDFKEIDNAPLMAVVQAIMPNSDKKLYL